MRYFVWLFNLRDNTNMRKYFVLLIFIPLLFQGCNDGDIIVTNFDFEDAQLQQCGDTY